ncbi:RICIN domain-containing protein [Streptomyces cirratus]
MAAARIHRAATWPAVTAGRRAVDDLPRRLTGRAQRPRRPWRDRGRHRLGTVYTLTGVASGRALDVPGGQGTNGARVQVADSSGGANQHRNLG